MHGRWPGARSANVRARQSMDIVVDLIKAVIALVAILVILILIPFLFMTIFSIATGLDERLNR